MARQPYKPQVTTASRPLHVVPTEYKEPSERTAAFGFASSILNGNTIEGGLRSLTYKSIFALKLTEELDVVRKTIVPEEFQLLRITEQDLVTSDRLERLRKEIAETQRCQRNEGNDEKIQGFNLRLDEELNNTKGVSEAYSKELKNFYLELYPDLSISYDNEAYKKHRLDIEVSVERMEDVEGFDGAIYAQKAEERIKEEAEAQRQKEQEELEAAERAREEAENDARAMDVEEDDPLFEFLEPYGDDGMNVPDDFGDEPMSIPQDLGYGNMEHY